MRWLIMATVVLLAGSALAEEHEPQGRDLMSEALRLFMKGLMSEMEPAFEDLEGLLQNLDVYHPPEVLPNGDIIIRRKTPIDKVPSEDGEIEL